MSASALFSAGIAACGASLALGALFFMLRAKELGAVISFNVCVLAALSLAIAALGADRAALAWIVFGVGIAPSLLWACAALAHDSREPPRRPWRLWEIAAACVAGVALAFVALISPMRLNLEAPEIEPTFWPPLGVLALLVGMTVSRVLRPKGGETRS